MGSLAAEFDGLLRAPPRRRAALARELARRGEEWSAWRDQFNRAHWASPEREAPAARALRAAYVHAGDALMAARLRMIEARAVHRVGSPREAAAAFERAAQDLAAAGDAERAVQARVVRVDALAVSGRLDEALSVAARLATRLEGPGEGLWRNVLRVNVANALRLRGDLDGALRRYDEAARAFTRLGQAQQAAIARMNAGVALLDAGRGEEALGRFEKAEREFEAAGVPDMALEARYNRACALVRAARLGEGVQALEVLVREHHARGLPRREALCRVDLADALLRAGDASSARAAAEHAATAFASLDAHAERCEALLLAAATAPSTAGTARLLRQARAAATSSARPAVVLRCDLLLEDARHRSGRPSREAIVRIARRASALRQTEIAAQAHLLLGEAALDARRPKEARTQFRDAMRAARGRPWIRAAAASGLARCLALEGKRARAITALREVAETLEAVRARLPGPWLRATFVLRRLDPWLARVELLLDRGSPEERREAETLLDARATRRFLERAPPTASRGAAGRLQQRLQALYDRIGRGAGPTRGSSPEELIEAEKQARAIESRVAESWRAVERAGPAAPGIRIAKPRSALLREQEAVLHVWVHDGKVRAVLRRGRDVPMDADLGRLEDVEAEVERLQFLADRVRLFGPEGAFAAYAGRLQELGDRLLAPLAGATGIEVLRLVLDPELRNVPWESLPLAGLPLVSRVALLRVPSLRLHRAVPRSLGPTTFLAATNDDLPGISDEAARLGPAATIVVGARATRQALAAALARPGVVHVAGHGLSSADAPALGGIRLSDGWFSSAEVPARVRAQIVVLASCRGGIEQGVAAQAWGGLPVALLASGARRVLWSSTDVDDRAVAEATTRFHAHLRTSGPEVAFGRAIAEAGADPRVAASLLPLRLSGVLP